MIKASINNGTILLVVVFAIALVATITVGILVMTTEEVQLMQNQYYSAQALAVAEAGLNDALAQIRVDQSWTPDGSYTDKAFAGIGTYTVQRSGQTLTSTADTSQGYQARVAADVTVNGSAPNLAIRIDNLRINE